ncbi:P-loop containing nucleoside triphosphate hydrolase protein [Epithele typhae]|uniref:P-loop containing nucleoside triphosphate hydrolase protein n=1 Tax=Epithele typhae TaxID=378194 RepID=UPI002007BC3A|nr:P-loop containing nucleoside triphosphate hydrolase protein [Epithele typhae]KAH9914882.1 P-loop containing nucleoside triphosphate hydrolase protein [Epithele typhae]
MPPSAPLPPQTPKSAPKTLPSFAELRKKTQEVFGRLPCLWQCRVASEVLAGQKDIVCISGTGSGKTLPFWMPLLFRPDGIQIVVSPLNALGSQNTEQLRKVGISAIAITAETATNTNIQDILTGKYRVVVVSPEAALKTGGNFERLWKSKSFLSNLISVVWDEAHLLKSWSSFRPDLGEASRIRNMIPLSIPFLLPTATMPTHILASVMDIARLRHDRLLTIRRSNDRPNVYLAVRKMKYSLSSYKDLDFLIPDGWRPGVPLRKFIIFFDNIEESIKAVLYLRMRLPATFRDKLKWFNSDNSPEFREEMTAALKDNKIFGLACTDAFGLGIDISDIPIVVQFRATCDLDTLWQRFGRGARDLALFAVAILLVERKYFDAEAAAAAERAAKRAAKRQAKAIEQETKKRRRTEEAAVKAKKKARTESSGDAAPEARDEEVMVGAEVVDLEVIDSDTEVETAVVAGGVEVIDRAEAVDAELMVVDEAQLTVFEALRVAYVQTHTALAAPARKRKGAFSATPLSPELDNFVNAATRPFKCHRMPVMAYYENDRIGLWPFSLFSLYTYRHFSAVSDEHKHCHPGGCRRCAPPSSSSLLVCCTQCNPTHLAFDFLPLEDAPAIKAPAARRASKLDDKVTLTQVDKDFRLAVQQFRDDQTCKMLGRTHLEEEGPRFIMGDKTLDRVVLCARANKIRSVEELHRETKWYRVKELGEELLVLVNRFYPPPPPLPPQPSSTSSAPQSVGSTRPTSASKTQRRCSACGNVGHIREPPYFRVLV